MWGVVKSQGGGGMREEETRNRERRERGGKEEGGREWKEGEETTQSHNRVCRGAAVNTIH